MDTDWLEVVNKRAVTIFVKNTALWTKKPVRRLNKHKFQTGPSRGGKGSKFSRAPRRLGAPPSHKNTEKGVPDGLFLTSNIKIKSTFGRGSAPGPTVGAYDAPQTPNWMVNGRPSPRYGFLLLDALRRLDL